METRHATTLHQNLQVSLHINTALYNSGLTEWWVLQHKPCAGTMIQLALQSGSSTSFLAAIGILIFLQRIWMALQQVHTPESLWRRDEDEDEDEDEEEDS